MPRFKVPSVYNFPSTFPEMIKLEIECWLGSGFVGGVGNEVVVSESAVQDEKFNPRDTSLPRQQRPYF